MLPTQEARSFCRLCPRVLDGLCFVQNDVVELDILQANRIAAHPRIAVSDLEAVIGTRYTYDALAYLRRRCPGVAFVWIMGSDNLLDFHRWGRWQDIAAMVPIVVIDRLSPRLVVTVALSPSTAAG